MEQLPLTLVSVDGIEADDTMAYISQQLLPKSDIMLMSTDKDFLQLVDNRIKVYSPTKKLMYDEDLKEKMGKRARKLAEKNHNWEKCEERVESLYRYVKLNSN